MESVNELRSAIRAEIAALDERIRDLSHQAALLEAEREGLERALRLVGGPSPALSEDSVVLRPRSRRGRKRSATVAARRDAMVAVLREQGAMGPADLLRALRNRLGDPSITRSQVTDALRRSPGEFFEAVGDGTWQLGADARTGTAPVGTNGEST